MKPLTEPEVEEFFAPHGHLAYRYTMLWTHLLRFPSDHGLEHAHAVCAFEACLLACRVFTDFLGLGLDRRTNMLVEKPRGGDVDDLRVTDLGGSCVMLSDLSPDQRELLADVYRLSNKSTAHFTHGAQGLTPASRTHLAVVLLDDLLRIHLYDRVGRKPTGHWQLSPKSLDDLMASRRAQLTSASS